VAFRQLMVTCRPVKMASRPRGSRGRSRRPRRDTPIPSLMAIPESGHHRLVKGLASFLTCPVCTNLMVETNIYACLHDHLVCGACHLRLTRCPVCRDPWRGHSRLAETLQEFVKEHCTTSCANEHLGCTVRSLPLGEGVAEHQMKCEYQLVPCPAVMNGHCQWKGLLKDLLAHCASESCASTIRPAHRGLGIRTYEVQHGPPPPSDAASEASPGPVLKHHVLVTSGAAKVCLSYSLGTQGLVAFLRLFGASGPLVFSKGTIQIRTDTGSPTHHTFASTLLSSGMSREEIMASGLYLQVSEAQLRALTDQEECVHLRVSLFMDDSSSSPPPLETPSASSSSSPRSEGSSV